MAKILVAIIKNQHEKQPKSKTEQVHEYQLKPIASYIAPPMSIHNATKEKVKFSQSSLELQTFNQDELVNM